MSKFRARSVLLKRASNRIRHISAVIEIHLRESVRWAPYVEHFRGPYGKPNKTMTHAGEVFVNIPKIIDSLAKEAVRVTPKQVRRRLDQLCECGILTQPRRVPANGGVIYRANFPDDRAVLNSAKYTDKMPKMAKYAPQKGRSNEEGKGTDILVNNEAKRAKYAGQKGQSIDSQKGEVSRTLKDEEFLKEENEPELANHKAAAGVSPPAPPIIFARIKSQLKTLPNFTENEFLRFSNWLRDYYQVNPACLNRGLGAVALLLEFDSWRQRQAITLPYRGLGLLIGFAKKVLSKHRGVNQ